MKLIADGLSIVGIMLLFLGGAAADSPGDKYLWAGAVMLAGCVLMALGQWVERRKTRRMMRHETFNAKVKKFQRHPEF